METAEGGAGKVIERLIGALRKLNVGNWAGRLIVLMQGHYPIYMTVRKGRREGGIR